MYYKCKIGKLKKAKRILKINYQSHFFVSALIETMNASTKDSITCSVASSNFCWSCEVLVLSKSGNLGNNKICRLHKISQSIS